MRKRRVGRGVLGRHFIEKIKMNERAKEKLFWVGGRSILPSNLS